MTLRVKVLLVALVIALATGGIYLRALVRRVFFESSQTADSSARTKLAEAALQTVPGNQTDVTLYFPSLPDGKLVIEVRSLNLASNDADRVRQILLALIEGSAEGFTPPLPASSELRAVFLGADGTAYLDFTSTNLAQIAPGIENETLAVYSVVDSLAANLPKIKRVKILVKGQEVDTLDGHIDLTGYFVPDMSRVKTAG